MTKKKENNPPPKKSAGYSFKKIITKKDKRGYKIFYEKTQTGKLIRVKKEEFQKAKITKDYYRSEYGAGVWIKKYNTAINEIQKIDNKARKDDKDEKEKALRELGYPIKQTALQTAIVSEVEQWLKEGYKVFIIKDGVKHRLTIDKAENFRELMSKFLDFFFDEFKESLKAVERLESDKRTAEYKDKQQRVKEGKKDKKLKQLKGGVSPFLQVPVSQVSGNKYGIVYEIDLDKVFFTDQTKTGKTENEFIQGIRNKFDKLFNKLF